MKNVELNYSPKTVKSFVLTSVILLCGLLVLNGCSGTERWENKTIESTYDDLTLTDIAFGLWHMSKDEIDSSDGNELGPGTYLTYKTSQGRYGKFFVESINKSANNQLTISWVTYNGDGTVYSSGSGLKIDGSCTCDLDSGKQTAKGSDFHWQMENKTTRNLSPRNGAIFRLMYRQTWKVIHQPIVETKSKKTEPDTDSASHATFTLSDEDLMALDIITSNPREASILDRRDVHGPGVEFDIFLPPGDATITCISSKRRSVDNIKYKDYGLSVTLLKIDNQTSGNLVFGARRSRSHRPVLIQKGKYNTSVNSISNNRALNHGFIVYRVKSKIANSPALKMTIKVAPVPGQAPIAQQI